MPTKLTKFVFVLFLLQVLIPARSALADTGPKPSMEFQFQQEVPGESLTIASGILYECEQSDCSDAAPIEEVGPQGFYCEPSGCRAIAYGFRPYHRIEIEFSDGVTRESNVFETAGFDSLYTVTVRPTDLLVEAQFSLGAFPRNVIVLLACMCAFVLVLALLAGVILFRRRRAARV